MPDEGINVSPALRQVFGAISAGLILTGQMSTWGYPAAALPQMQHPNSTIHLSSEESSWFASVTLLLSIPGPIIGAVIWEWTGLRRLYLAWTPLLILSMMAMAIAASTAVQEAGLAEIVLLICRVIQGLIVAVLHPLNQLYTYEICEQRLRGTLMSITEAWATVGFLLCYITGCFMTWDTIAWFLPLITMLPGFLGLLFTHESPLWLARRGKEKEALKVLKKYRTSDQEIQDDLEVVYSNLQKKPKLSEELKLLMTKPNALAVLASCSLTMMKEFSGYATLGIYVVHIFGLSGVGLDPKYSSVIVGVVRLCCNSVASVLIHNFRRKVILISGNAVVCVAATTMGVFFYLQRTGYDVSMLEWLPLTSLSLHILGSAVAIGATSWTMAVEILPGPVRSIGFSIAVTAYSVGAFINSKTFTSLQELIGMHGVFWVFTFGSIFSNILLIFFLPETFGLSLGEVDDYWYSSSEKKKNRKYEAVSVAEVSIDTYMKKDNTICI